MKHQLFSILSLFIAQSVQYLNGFRFNSINRKSSYFQFEHTSRWSKISATHSDQIEYVIGSTIPSFTSLEDIGLSVIDELKNRTAIPFHITTAYDVFCNRELNMQQITAIGFDMDFTLAQYTEDFDLLAYNGAKEKLVALHDYPEEVLGLKYESQDVSRRGNMVDKKRGNIIKLDQHRYVRAVEHGLTKLSREQRKSVYKEKFEGTEQFTGNNFANIDTPFSLVDACLFAQLVDLKDRLIQKDELTSRERTIVGKSYPELYRDMRCAVDRCHKDGVIKKQVAKNPEKYIIYDPKLFPMLKSFRDSGRKVFLLTNSLWDYTDVVMNYLENPRKQGPQVPGAADRDLKWADYFDLVIVGGNKPSFLLDERSLPLFKIDPSSGALENLECLPSSNAAGITTTTNSVGANFLQEQGKFFQGGNAQVLHSLLDLPRGDSLLYVGDHIYSDILRSKRSLGWRTCLIVPELAEEIAVHKKMRKQREELLKLRKKQFMMENLLDSLYVQYYKIESNDGQEEISKRREEMKEDIKTLKAEIRMKLNQYDNAFHPRWGQLFKAGFQESRIAKQIKDYACIYTSKVSNLGQTSPVRTFRPARDKMSHEHFVEGL